MESEHLDHGLDMFERTASLRRAVRYGLDNGKGNMIVKLDVLAAVLNMPFVSTAVPGAAPRPDIVRVRSSLGEQGWALRCVDRCDKTGMEFVSYAVCWDDGAGGGFYKPNDVAIVEDSK
jgi:hypothetical protein